jgi:FMN phosphatase YigB (HAD superfamily)
MIKAIIFDWGRTLYDSEGGCLATGAADLLPTLARHYKLAIVSLVSGDYEQRLADRQQLLRDSGVESCFAVVHFVAADKDGAYAETLTELGVQAQEVAIVDDRVRRGIAWGNRHGALTIWLCRGRFAAELPDELTGVPTHTIGELRELSRIL